MTSFKVLNENILIDLIHRARESPERRARFNFHPESDSQVQEMIIVSYPDTDIKIHGHKKKSESFCILWGKLDVFIFDCDSPTLRDVVSLEAGKANCYYRLDSNNPHLVAPRTTPAIFLEITCGPFTKGENFYIPEWSHMLDTKKFLEEYYEKEKANKL